ncbi:FG-GAP repeat-containing protein [Streptomyces sp. 3213]|uniref:FG-GAP-like repeat-containing protein n=1 Tax=Streptomyces sp. 3213.3 TaxID=1855348 RepID=UPI000894CD4C|nr:FG-GAP-like repeat-containing protein [Streptomyces sp. 3213.3]SED96796.1 FG-GAP repeat-containing protein [Streptomyces sp. 3213] [Streptomyces sp. 3213.3]
MGNSRTARGRWRAAAVVAAALVGGTLLPAAPALAVHGAVPGDFNGDGYRDAVLPAPGATVAGKEQAGAVVVLYGSASGLSAARRKTITQNTPGVPSSSEAWDQFGAATATADLNRDGYADLVVSAPYEDTADGANAGLVTVLWGSRNGLTTATDLPSPQREASAEFGLDLAAVSTGAGTRTQVEVGGLAFSALFRGPFSRTGTYGGASLQADTASVASVALGDFDGDALPDQALVTVGQVGLSGGSVYVDPTVGTEPKQGNGLIDAAGDINGDGYADLVVGDPWEPEVAGVDGALGGRVLVYYGSATGIAATAKPLQVTQNTAGVPDTSEKGDAFGGALTVADLNRDGLADIVVGAPYEGVAGKRRAGAVTVIPGRRTGALGAGSYSFTQDTAGVPGASETDDFFGTTVSVGDVDKDGKPELFVSAAQENNSTGAVWVFPGGTSRPTATGTKLFTGPAVGLTQRSGTALGGYGLLWLI